LLSIVKRDTGYNAQNNNNIVNHKIYKNELKFNTDIIALKLPDEAHEYEFQIEFNKNTSYEINFIELYDHYCGCSILNLYYPSINIDNILERLTPSTNYKLIDKGYNYTTNFKISSGCRKFRNTSFVKYYYNCGTESKGHGIKWLSRVLIISTDNWKNNAMRFNYTETHIFSETELKSIIRNKLNCSVYEYFTNLMTTGDIFLLSIFAYVCTCIFLFLVLFAMLQ